MKKNQNTIITIITFILTISLLGSNCVYASDISPDIMIDSGIIIKNNSSKREPTLEEREHFSIYADNYEIMEHNGTILGVILNHLNGIKKELILDNPSGGSLLIREFYTNGLSAVFPMCEDDSDIQSVTLLNGLYYVQYKALDDNIVIATYSETGLWELLVYSESSDTVFINEQGVNYIVEGFRSGWSYELSEELEERIDSLIKVNDYNAINEINGIQVVQERGSIVITPTEDVFNSIIPSGTRTVKSNFANDTAVLNNLKSWRPPYTNTQLSSNLRYCSYLNTNVIVKVTESCNNYVKRSANWTSYGIGVALSVIGTFLAPGASAAVQLAAYVITTIGVAISTYNTITEAVELYGQVKYRFYADRTGWVFDTTSYYDYVNVLRFTDTGEFQGAYAIDDYQWHWFFSVYPSLFSGAWTSQTIENATIGLYNADLVENGSTTYTP